MKLPLFLFAALPLLAGCWAISDLATNRDFDRSLPYDTEVKFGALSVRTPVVHLIEEKTKDGISLRDVYVGIVEPERYTAVFSSRLAFDTRATTEKGLASEFREYPVVINDQRCTVTMMRFDRKNSVKLVYLTFLGGSADGVVVANTSYFMDTAFERDRWWDKPPEFFLRFARSVRFKTEPNQPPLPTSGLRPAAADL